MKFYYNKPHELDDPMVALANLKQSGSVQEYYKSFISSPFDEAEKNLISLFLASLREDLRVKVKMTKPLTMESVYRSAYAQEAIAAAKMKIVRALL